jgi:hypothetical protein
MIYQINDLIKHQTDFVCPDQATIDEGKADGYIGVFIIGTQADADALLKTNQDAWLNQNINLFTVNKDIDTDPIQTTWIVCNLDTESPNTDIDYNVFDVVNGYYNLATGLDNAKALLEKTKQDYLTFCNLGAYVSYETWPVIPKSFTISTGVQTL